MNVSAVLSRVPIRRLPARTVAAIVSVALVLWLAQGAAQLTWLIWPEPDLPPRPPADIGPAQTTAQGEDNTEGRIELLARRSLFGSVQTEPQRVQRQPVETIAKTRLNLELRGVWGAPDPNIARAIIAVGRGKEAVYSVGETIENAGATIAEIYGDRVILDRAGRRERLDLPREKAAGMQLSEAAEETDAESGPFEQAMAEEDLESLPPEVRAQLERMAEMGGDQSRQEVADLARSIRENPQSLGELLRFEPARNGSQLIGYRLYPKQGSEVFTQLGLEPGDVLVEGNGIRLDSPRNAMRLLTQLRRATSLSAVVQRDGREIPVSLDL